MKFSVFKCSNDRLTYLCKSSSNHKNTKIDKQYLSRVQVEHEALIENTLTLKKFYRQNLFLKLVEV